MKISQNVLGGYFLLTLYIPKCLALYRSKSDATLKITIHCSRVTSLTCIATEFIEAENLPPNSGDLNVVDALSKLSNNNCIVKRFKTLIISKASVTLLGHIRQDTIQEHQTNC